MKSDDALTSAWCWEYLQGNVVASAWYRKRPTSAGAFDASSAGRLLCGELCLFEYGDGSGSLVRQPTQHTAQMLHLSWSTAATNAGRTGIVIDIIIVFVVVAVVVVVVAVVDFVVGRSFGKKQSGRLGRKFEGG